MGSLYTARRKRAKKKGKKAPRKLKPPKLSDWIKGPLKPPTGKLEAPGFAFLKKAFPQALPDGKAFVRSTPKPKHLEKLRVPEEHPKYARWLEKDKNRERAGSLKWPHWHIDSQNVPFYHLKKAWGRADSGRWSWMLKHKRRWWTVGDGAQRLVRHSERWWWKTADGWFLLHRGQPWAYRHFAEWKRDGFIHPQSGTRIVYSADGLRVAVITPGRGSRVFDARTGKLLAYFPEA